MMETFTIITTLNILLSFMVSPSASLQILEKMPHPQDHLRQNVPALPRKLMLHEEANVKNVENKHYQMPYKVQEEVLPVIPEKLHHKYSKIVHARKGTRQEWLEGKDRLNFFMMDYMGVRRRRPVHNKFVPVAP